MCKTIIIARFNEDISWLDSYKDFKIIIYNKGEKITKNQKIINLKNVGRESHTWIYHIVKNYDNLDEINIFLQGRIDDLGCMAFDNPNYYVKPVIQYGFAASRYGLLGPTHWKWNVGIEKDIRYKKAWFNNEISKSSIGFRSFAKNLFPEIPYFVATSYGGCFAIKKELILNYEKSFYIKLLNILEKHKNPIEGHYMERLWCYLFTKNSLLPKAYNDVLLTKFEISKEFIQKLFN
tara:strand:+ start:3198 stop:3902 length:705 start_codon:yes stop_codon:yes gene_type:complete